MLPTNSFRFYNEIIRNNDADLSGLKVRKLDRSLFFFKLPIMLNSGLGVAIIYFGSGLSFLLAVQRILTRQKGREDRLAAVLFAALGIILFSSGNVVKEVDQTYPHSIFLLLTSFSTVGPLTLLYTRSLLYPNQALDRDVRLHFIVPGIFLILELFFFARPIPVIIADLKEFRTIRFRHYLAFSFLITTLLTTGYFLVRYRMLLTVFSVKEIRPQIRFILTLATVTVCAMYSLIFGFMVGWNGLFEIGGMLVTLTVILLFLAPARYPNFFAPLTREVRRKKYEKSLLVGLDLALLELRMDELMREGKLYRDPDLTLHSLADDLEIKPYQLTEFLNEHLQVGFYNYINRFRIDEAVALLSENPEKDILSICYFVGFNSKSSFNDAFRKMTGETPSQLRRTRFEKNKVSPKSRVAKPVEL
ncbi:DNA-binding helix-turn-helix protein [Leptospira inadai serovar Lyme str. 10]|uniref:DNA-binding helix-turn-helix protein n=2 Tax=Leptospira inadai serovar Lyme TaxID=293084 RepID=V6HFB4_9LEPT|nr:DNA-binding helix-turn-helix protein [Leptospira inadai serovar Lyme str. 10]